MKKQTKIVKLAKEILANLDTAYEWLDQACLNGNGTPLYRGHWPEPGQPRRYHDMGGIYSYPLFPGEYDSRAIRLFLGEVMGMADTGKVAFSKMFSRALEYLVQTGKIGFRPEPGCTVFKRWDQTAAKAAPAKKKPGGV